MKLTEDKNNSSPGEVLSSVSILSEKTLTVCVIFLFKFVLDAAFSVYIFFFVIGFCSILSKLKIDIIKQTI